MTEPSALPLPDPVVRQACVGALNRIVALRAEVAEALRSPDLEMEGLTCALSSAVADRSDAALDSACQLGVYHQSLLGAALLAGVSSAESAIDLVTKELIWYEQLAVLAASLDELSRGMPDPAARHHLLSQAVSTVERLVGT